MLDSTNLKNLNLLQNFIRTNQVHKQIDAQIQNLLIMQVKKQFWAPVWAENPLIYVVNPLLMNEGGQHQILNQVYEQVDSQFKYITK